jgi:hypothetical protein
VQTKDSSGNVLRTVAYTWITSGGANVINVVSNTLENGLQSAIVYANYDTFGNPADVYEYDFGGALLRHTVSTYAITRFGPQHILDLPTQVLIKDAGGTNVARTDFDYDTTQITNVTDAANHDNNADGTWEFDLHHALLRSGNARRDRGPSILLRLDWECPHIRLL